MIKDTLLALFQKYVPDLVSLSAREHQERVTDALGRKGWIAVADNLGLLALCHSDEEGVAEFFIQTVSDLCTRPDAWPEFGPNFDRSPGTAASHACVAGCFLDGTSEQQQKIRWFSAETCLEYAQSRYNQSELARPDAVRMVSYAYVASESEEAKKAALDLWQDFTGFLAPNLAISLAANALEITRPGDPLHDAALSLWNDAITWQRPLETIGSIADLSFSLKGSDLESVATGTLRSAFAAASLRPGKLGGTGRQLQADLRRIANRTNFPDTLRQVATELLGQQSGPG